MKAARSEVYTPKCGDLAGGMTSRLQVMEWRGSKYDTW